jgi:hypothetical protein
MLVDMSTEMKVFFPPGWNITYFTFYINLWPIYWLSRSSVGTPNMGAPATESSTVTKARCDEFQRRSTKRRQPSRWGNTPNGWLVQLEDSPTSKNTLQDAGNACWGDDLTILEIRKEFIRRLQRLGTTIPLILERVMTPFLNRHKKNHEEPSKHQISFLFIPWFLTHYCSKRDKARIQSRVEAFHVLFLTLRNTSLFFSRVIDVLICTCSSRPYDHTVGAC